MLLFGIDLETTSVDVETAEIVEIGWALYDVKFNQIISCGSDLIQPENFDEIDGAELEKVTGISKEMLYLYGNSLNIVHSEIYENIEDSDYVVAHNGNSFDRPILERSLYNIHREIADKVWIDTLHDVPYPSNVGSKSLTNLCAVHGFLNPFPHRALFDVAAMFKLLAKYDLSQVIRRAESPSIWLHAVVTFDDKDLAKKRRYHWDDVNKMWVKMIKEIDYPQEKFEAEFRIRVLDNYVKGQVYI